MTTTFSTNKFLIHRLLCRWRVISSIDILFQASVGDLVLCGLFPIHHAEPKRRTHRSAKNLHRASVFVKHALGLGKEAQSLPKIRSRGVVRLNGPARGVPTSSPWVRWECCGEPVRLTGDSLSNGNCYGWENGSELLPFQSQFVRTYTSTTAHELDLRTSTEVYLTSEYISNQNNSLQRRNLLVIMNICERETNAFNFIAMVNSSIHEEVST